MLADDDGDDGVLDPNYRFTQSDLALTVLVLAVLWALVMGIQAIHRHDDYTTILYLEAHHCQLQPTEPPSYQCDDGQWSPDDIRKKAIHAST